MANNTGLKHGGRQSGTPNNLTKELKAALKNILHQEIELLPERLNSLTEKDRLEIIVKLIPYVLPKCMDENKIINKDFVSIPLIQWVK